MSKINAEEQHFDFSVIDKVVEQAVVYDIRDIATDSEVEIKAVDTLAECSENDVIIDIRSFEEQDDKPLVIADRKIINLPFFKLASQFPDLDQTKHYLLYCDHGVMSKLQALYLQDAGYHNVKVYRPTL